MPANFFLKRSPFLKLLLPLTTGILCQQYQPLPLPLLLGALGIIFLLLIAFRLLPPGYTFRLRYIKDMALVVALFCTGAILLSQKNTSSDKKHFTKNYKNGDYIIAVINEPIITKANSYKAEAVVNTILSGDTATAATGKINIYFKKDSLPALHFGDKIIFSNPLQEIKSTGNPGAFNYKRYAAFNGITHTAFLRPGDYTVLGSKASFSIQHSIFQLRAYVLNTIKRYIPQPKEQGLAEAMLIGYKDDLDKTLLRSYSNTGVVHVIAVSGMHLGLIYWILELLLQPLSKRKKTAWISTLIILFVLWLFTLLTGLAPSIVRAAVMFTCLLIGRRLNRSATIYNSLAASAFILLCCNPYWAWDAGFQLSYAALLSIIIFQPHIYRLLKFNNKILNAVWNLVAVTIAAQILTAPLVLYYFHQFPLYFVLTNLVAVPLSSIILAGEIILIALSGIPQLAALAGKILYWLIWLLNVFIEKIERWPFAAWENITLSPWQALLLYMVIAGIAVFIIHRRKPALYLGLGALFLSSCLRLADFYRATQRQQMIVYNDAKKTAIEFITGRQSQYLGDTALLQDDSTSYPLLKPAHQLYRIQQSSYVAGNAYIFNNKKIVWLGSAPQKTTATDTVDYLVLSGNPKLYMKYAVQNIYPKKIIITASVPAYKATYWKKDCDSLHIPYYDVRENGAFVVSF